MAPRDLLAPLQGQREETFKVLDSLSEADLERVDESTGWSVRAILGHIASAELGEAFFIRSAAAGELIQMDADARDSFNHDEVAKVGGWTLDRLRTEIDEARETLTEVFSELEEDDLDRAIRWPEWPARTIRASIPYMLEHEDAHIDQVRSALGHE
ncbi:MAG TPA: DinB family protein [Candidatus Dormibacteraeota bacterium]|nr:DinB family protein [Candidatus Dormibacteraeota bacterium]